MSKRRCPPAPLSPALAWTGFATTTKRPVRSMELGPIVTPRCGASLDRCAALLLAGSVPAALESLDLSGGSLRDGWLSHPLPALCCLRLCGCGLQTADVYFDAETLPSLQVLALDANYGLSLPPMIDCPELESLSLASCGLRAPLPVIVAPRLRHLSVAHNEWAVVGPLREMQADALRSLDLSGCGLLHDLTAELLARCPRLESLGAGFNFELGLAGLAGAAERLPHVARLDLRGCGFGPHAVLLPLPLGGLVELDLSRNPGIGLVLSAAFARSLPGLRALALDQCELETISAAVLAALVALEQLSVRRNPAFSVVCLRDAAGQGALQQLQLVDARGCGLGASSAETLEGVANFQM